MRQVVPSKHTTLLSPLPIQKKKKTFHFLFPLVPNKTVGLITQILKGMYIIPMILPPCVSVHHQFSAKTGNIRATTRRCHDAVSSTAWVIVIYLSSWNKRNTGKKAMKRKKSSAVILYLTFQLCFPHISWFLLSQTPAWSTREIFKGTFLCPAPVIFNKNCRFKCLGSDWCSSYMGNCFPLAWQRACAEMTIYRLDSLHEIRH